MAEEYDIVNWRNAIGIDMKLIPDSECFVCRKGLNAIGGQRIVCNAIRGTSLSKQPSVSMPHADACLSEKVGAGPELFFHLWGEVSFCTQENLFRAIDRYRQGARVWFCQACSKRVCK